MQKSEMGLLAIDAARQAGALLMQSFGKLSQDQIETKNRSDFVTEVDKASEKKVIDLIKAKYPDHKIFAEETTRDETGGYRWIIDPLDGTTNYIHGVPIFSVSIGLELDGEIILGVVYDPTRDEMFYAEMGKGAYLNDLPIHVSNTADPAVALLATGYPFRVMHLIDPYQESFKGLFRKVSGIRRAGSAAIDLVYVAAGRFDGFWELDLHAWDIAASYVILQEAGGMITDFAGGDDVLKTGNTVASNSLLHAEILDVVKDVFAGIVDK